MFAEGEDERVLRAVQVMVDEGLAQADPRRAAPRCSSGASSATGCGFEAGSDFEIVNPEDDPRFRDYWTEYHRLTERRGVSIAYAQIEMRRRHTLIGAMMIHKGHADGMICGTFGTHDLHLHYIDQVIGRRAGVKNYYAMNLLMLPQRTVFICDTYVNLDPTPEQLLEMTLLAAEEIRRFGLTPKVALLSHSNFGTSDAPSAAEDARRAGDDPRARPRPRHRRRDARRCGACREAVRTAAFPNSRLKGEANLLVMPTLDAANISFNLLKVVGGRASPSARSCSVQRKPVHILTPDGDRATHHQHDRARRGRRAGVRQAEGARMIDRFHHLFIARRGLRALARVLSRCARLGGDPHVGRARRPRAPSSRAAA